ncbi:MAG: 50S ribosomal protein L20 [Bacteriovoracales bacterium]
MPRVKRGFKARQRRNKVLKRAKGFHFDRRTKFRHALQTVVRALHNSYKGRKLLKRDMRSLWVVRIGAAAKMLDTSYSRLMHALKQKSIMLNRKMLAEVAAQDMEGFKAIVSASK